MARIALLGLGGGGSRFVSELWRWLESNNLMTPGEQVEKDWDFGAWQFGSVRRSDGNADNKPILPTGIGIVALDVDSRDMDRAEDIFPERYMYRLANRDGFGGNRKEAFDEINSLQESLERQEDDGRKPGIPGTDIWLAQPEEPTPPENAAPSISYDGAGAFSVPIIANVHPTLALV